MSFLMSAQQALLFEFPALEVDKLYCARGAIIEYAAYLISYRDHNLEPA